MNLLCRQNILLISDARACQPCFHRTDTLILREAQNLVFDPTAVCPLATRKKAPQEFGLGSIEDRLGQMLDAGLIAPRVVNDGLPLKLAEVQV